MGPWYVWAIAAVVGGVIIVIVVFLYGLLMNLLTDRPGPGSGRVARSGREPIGFRFELGAERPPDLDEIAWALVGHGLKRVVDARSTADLVLTGGSELWARLGGGYSWGDLSLLPTRVELSVARQGGADRKVELLISDNCHRPLWRERQMEERYSKLAARLRMVVEGELSPPESDLSPARRFR